MAMKQPVTAIDPGQVRQELRAQEEQPAAGARTYFISIPIRTITGHLTEEQLDKISMNLAVYGSGVLLVGLLAILFPLLFVLSMPKFIAWLLILGGSMSLLQFFLMCGAPGMSSFLLLGILHLLSGLWILLHPVRGVNMLVLILSSWFLLHGLIKLIMAAQLRNLVTWPAVLSSGLVSIVLAFTALILAPRFGFLMLSIMLGSDLIVSGTSMLLISCIAFFGKRGVSNAPASSGPLREPLMSGMSQAAASA